MEQEEINEEYPKRRKTNRIPKSKINSVTHLVANRGRFVLDTIEWFEDHINDDFVTEERRYHMKIAIRGLKMAANAMSQFLATLVYVRPEKKD